MRAAICSFLGGAAVASTVGGYFLQQSIYKSSGDLSLNIEALGKNVAKTNTDLEARVAALEAKAPHAPRTALHRAPPPD